MHTNIMGFNFQPAYYRQLFAAITGKSLLKINIKGNYIFFFSISNTNLFI